MAEGALVLVGTAVGVLLGRPVGVLVAVFTGVFVGVRVGVLVGVLVGVRVGVLVGVLVGARVGVRVGVFEGCTAGKLLPLPGKVCALISWILLKPSPSLSRVSIAFKAAAFAPLFKNACPYRFSAGTEEVWHSEQLSRLVLAIWG